MTYWKRNVCRFWTVWSKLAMWCGGEEKISRTYWQQKSALEIFECIYMYMYIVKYEFYFISIITDSLRKMGQTRSHCTATLEVGQRTHDSYSEILRHTGSGLFLLASVLHLVVVRSGNCRTRLVFVRTDDYSQRCTDVRNGRHSPDDGPAVKYSDKLHYWKLTFWI